MVHSIKKVFQEYEKNKDSLEISIDSMKEILKQFKDKVVLYGAGSSGIALLYYLRKLEISPLYFSDGNSAKWGEKCENILIIAPQEIVSKVGADALVIITINTDGIRYCKSFDEALRKNGHNGVHNMLHLSGCKNVIDYNFFRRCHKLFIGDPYNLPSCSDVASVLAHQDEVSESFEYLNDELSREIYLKIVEFRVLDDSIKIPTLSQKNQYFEYNIFTKSNSENFVDCGAFNGITLENFLRNNGNVFSKYYAFEPDRKNMDLFCNYVKKLDQDIQNKIECNHCIVYDKATTKKLYNLSGPGSFVSDIGLEDVSTDTIDRVLRGRKASFIKMNIEGVEINALKGAEDTIRKCKPILVVAGYHKTWDLWEIPKIMKKFYSGYKIYLRSYMNHISFFYYAVPEERIKYKH